jgi:hypothetical protein
VAGFGSTSGSIYKLPDRLPDTLFSLISNCFQGGLNHGNWIGNVRPRQEHARRVRSAAPQGREIGTGGDLEIASLKWRDLDGRQGSLTPGGYLPKEATMQPTGAVFQPELIELMKAVLDDAAAMLPEAKRTSTIKAEIASHILACAAKGERDPVALRMAALLAVAERTHYSHDISPERRAV